jgi:ferredoxin
VSYRITDECISCGACEAECKNEAISEGDTTYVIEGDKCTECVGIADGPRCKEVCPIDDCCAPDPGRSETKEQLLEKWRKLHPGEEPAAGTY